VKFQGIKLLPLITIIVSLFVFSLIFPEYLIAKSGCCSSHGGVSCAAGPQVNGNVICNDGWKGSSCSYAGMVMCGGPSAPTTTTVFTPVPTPKPTPVYTIAPTLKPTETPTQSPEIQGVSTETSPSPTIQPTQEPTPTPKPLTAGETTMALGVLAVIIGLPIWIIVGIIKRFRKPKEQI